MDDARPPDPASGSERDRADSPARRALTLLERGGDLLASGDFADAGAHFARVVGFDDPAITAAALLGLGEAHYRLNDEAAAVADLVGRPRAARDAVDLRRLAEHRRRPGPRRRPDAGAIDGLSRRPTAGRRPRTRPRSRTGSAG